MQVSIPQKTSSQLQETTLSSRRTQPQYAALQDCLDIWQVSVSELVASVTSVDTRTTTLENQVGGTSLSDAIDAAVGAATENLTATIGEFV